MFKITEGTLKLINGLSAGKRAKVDAIIRAHVDACRKNGFQPDNLERVFIEAVEIVELEERFPEEKPEPEGNRWDPVRRYEQYRSPKAF